MGVIWPWGEERKNESEGITVGLGKVIGYRMEIPEDSRIYLASCLWSAPVTSSVHMEDTTYSLALSKGVKTLKRTE